MVRSRFPGKPSKLVNRKKVTSYSDLGDADGFAVAEDTHTRLAVFNSLFPESDEDSSFHGFSPHKKGPPKLRMSQGPSKMSPAVKTNAKAARENGGASKSVVKSTVVTPAATTSKSSTPCDEKPGKKSENTAVAVSGFILPSRSVHSSRVIKPNKRFIESDSTTTADSVLSKKPRLARDGSTSIDDKSANSEEATSDSVLDGSVNNSVNDVSCQVTSNLQTEEHSSPTKFVLRKPTLNITSQPFSTVEGRFSTSGNAVFKDSNSRHATKVVCGVCGIMKSYRYIGQARKFGIHSCDYCRRFIVRMIRMEREKTLEQLSCASGTGNCPIRQSSLAVCKSFTVEEPSVNKADKEISNRCKGCWLNLCLRSFKLLEEVSSRLAGYLPRELSKPINGMSGNWGELERICGDKVTSNKPNSSEKVSHKKKARNDVCAIKIKGKQKLNASGPRVKHVCRSASLVLGQPVATFEGPVNRSPPSDPVQVSNEIERKIREPCATERALVPLPSNEKPKKVEDIVISDEKIFRDKNFDVPIARMLQDLGRDNCDLLDGFERYDLERKLAKVSIDFWESYDPEEVSQTGFSLIGFNPLSYRPLCYICGSAGFEKLIHCANCCEPYHTFCVSSLRFETEKKEWWKIDWLCPKCTNCEVCSKTGSGQIGCSKCFKSYHTTCLPSGRANISDCNWVCPSCLECKSCKDSSVHMLVGNIPLCKNCFKLRKKGNYCPLCQGCYDDNDYDTKMMECAECSHWIHAKCEKLSDEKYQFLSYLPATIEFVCSNCSKNRPAFWMTAVSDQLKTGCLNVLKTLSKNKTFCTVVKASPVKLPRCTCQDSRSRPIMLKNLNSHFDKHGEVDSPIDSILTTTTAATSATDLGLLTPKLTKDDEASLETVKTGLLSLVNDNKVVVDASKIPIYDFHEDEYDPTLTLNRTGGRLLSILDGNRGKMNEALVDKNDPPEIKCNCSIMDGVAQPLSLMDIKKKSSSGEYSSVFEFNNDSEKVIRDIGDDKLLNFYHETLKQAFPWFDPNEENVHDTSSHNIDSINESKTLSGRKSFESDYSLSPRKVPPPKPAFTTLLDRDPKYYYIGLTSQDVRMCMLCKGTGEGDPKLEGRLLYCGQNEWVHANCALWSSEVFEEIDGSLQNVQSAISRARLIRCSGCGNKGASVGCCARSCPSAYHFSCAKIAEAIFLDNKEVYCKAHSHCRGSKELHREDNYPLPRPIYVELDHKKKKDVLVNDVRLCVGSLMVDCFGEIISEFSDLNDFVLPINFRCERLFWSIKEPWKLVKYNIRVKVVFPDQDLTSEFETNYTINHASLETPPPSPGEDKIVGFCVNEIEVAGVLNYLMDVVCSKEEENNLADQQTTDLLLPPDIKDALFEDLPHDLLDGISMHDIFTKMNFDEALLSEPKTEEPAIVDNGRRGDEVKTSKYSKKNVGIYYKPAKRDDRGGCNKWKRNEIIQVDGAMDFSESDHSNDSCDVQMESNGCDSPVKCGRCRRTYRSSIGFERHLPTCSDDLSVSESDSSDDDLGIAGETYYKTIESKVETTCIETVLQPVCNGVTSHMNSYQGSPFETHLTPTVETIPQETTYLSTVQTNLMDPVMDVQSSPTIILQQMPVESQAPSYMQAFPQQTQQTTYAQQAPTNIQYIVNSEKSQFLAPSINGGYHIQSTPVVPNVSPTVVGTIINSNGIDQIVLNNAAPGIEMYTPQQSNVLITNTPMIVGMETVVSNTVMSSSQFISGSMPGMLASSYSATTTQVFHKPTVIDVPQSYVVVDTNPPVVNNVPCVVRNAPTNHPWNNYQTSYQESSYKLNKNVSYQTVTRQIITEQKEIDGLKLNSTQETIFIEPFSGKSTSKPLSEVRPITEIKEPPAKMSKPTPPKFVNGTKTAVLPKAQAPKVNQAKLVELPNSSAVHKEKPQQAVAPVVVKQLPMIVTAVNQPQEKPSETKNTFTPSNDTAVASSNNKCSTGPPPPPPPPQCSQASQTTAQSPAPPPNVTATPVSTPKPLAHRTYSYKSGKPLNQTVPKPILPKPTPPPPVELETPQQNIVDVPKIPPPPPPQPRIPSTQVQPVSCEEPKMTFEIISEDGFSFSTSSLEDAWKTVFDSVQKAREAKGLPLLTKNPFSSPEAMLTKLLGMGNNSVKYILEQLPGISGCTNYKPVFHKKKPTALEQELARKTKENKTGCARTEKFKHAHIKYDMFSWLASRHRRPPKLLFSDNDGLSGNRRATSLNLPMAMRFRHLKETSKMAVGVFRSDIHGRGLFCLRDIDSGEMVIEYAGEVIRSALTDKRERYYTARGIGCYMFRIDDKFVVDATMKGNAARFINHSCEPNCYSKVVDILGKKHILIFALRKILQGEELTYDYKFPLEEEKISCHCLSRRCRKYLN